MKPALLIVALSLALMPLASLADTASANETARDGATGFAIPTFHCLGLYWSPPGGTADKEVLVRYRAKGSSAWKEGLPMRYHPIAGTDEDLTDYRGSIVHLTPDNLVVSNNERNVDNDYDYDLFNGRVPEGVESHGVRGEPTYADGAGLDRATMTGQFQLAPDSPGAGAGQKIPNFSDGHTGDAPDMGAHQRGTAPMRFGVRAGQE